MNHERAAAARGVVFGGLGLTVLWYAYHELGITVTKETVARYVLIPLGLMMLFVAVWHIAAWLVKDE